MDFSGNKKVSVCIPCYDMHGLGALFLNENMTALENQTLKDFNVIISDHSNEDQKAIEWVCQKFATRGLEIKYLRNSHKIGNSSANLNSCLEIADGQIIKIIFEDDFLYHPDSLKDIVESFAQNPDKYWLVSSCCHLEDNRNFSRFIDPVYTEDILTGNNKISSPSVLSFRNRDKIYFDENFIWLMDCDYYYRLKLKHGTPIILNKTNVVNRLWQGQLTKNIPNERMAFEHDWILQKHNYGTN